MVFKIKKGLEIPIKGEPSLDTVNEVTTKSVGVLGSDFHGMRPTMLV